MGADLKKQFEEISEIHSKTHLICDLGLWIITSEFIIQRASATWGDALNAVGHLHEHPHHLRIEVRSR